jgi:hypothetical protein
VGRRSQDREQSSDAMRRLYAGVWQVVASTNIAQTQTVILLFDLRTFSICRERLVLIELSPHTWDK